MLRCSMAKMRSRSKAGNKRRLLPTLTFDRRGELFE
jgi:hypothetical protein